MLTAQEAAEQWGLNQSTVRNACLQGRFEPHEARKSGGTWLVTRAAMERVYGSLNKKEESPMEFTNLQEAMQHAAEKAYNGGVKQNITGYIVEDHRGVMIAKITTQAFKAYTTEELQDIDWWLYADEWAEAAGIDPSEEGKFTVKPY